MEGIHSVRRKTLQTQQGFSHLPDNSSINSTDLGDGWIKVNGICGKKKVNGKLYFQVLWSDGTKSYEPQKNVSEYAISEYFVRTKQKQNQKRRRNRDD